MAVTAFPYGQFLLALGQGAFTFPTDTLAVALTTSSYTPNIATDTYLSHLTNEVTGTGYTAGGAQLTNVTWTYDATNTRAVLGADPVTWTNAAFTVRFAVVYKVASSAATSRLIGYIDLGVDKTYAAEDAQLSFPSGVARVKSA